MITSRATNQISIKSYAARNRLRNRLLIASSFADHALVGLIVGLAMAFWCAKDIDIPYLSRPGVLVGALGFYLALSLVWNVTTLVKMCHKGFLQTKICDRAQFLTHHITTFACRLLAPLAFSLLVLAAFDLAYPSLLSNDRALSITLMLVAITGMALCCIIPQITVTPLLNQDCNSVMPLALSAEKTMYGSPTGCLIVLSLDCAYPTRLDKIHPDLNIQPLSLS